MNKVILPVLTALILISCSGDEILVPSDLNHGVISGRVRNEFRHSVPFHGIGTIPSLGKITTDINGTFRIEHVKPGTYLLQTKTETQGAAKRTIEVKAGEETDVLLMLSKLTTVDGYVVGSITYEDGTAVPYAVIKIADATDVTDLDGRFSMSTKEMGRTVFTVSNKYGIVLLVDTVDIDSYLTTELNIVIPLSAIGKAPLITKGLEAYYPLDGSARDASGNHHDGKLIGNPTFVSEEWTRRLEHVHIKGSEQQIRVSHSDDFNSLPLTIAFWFAANAACPSNAMILGKNVPSTGEGYYFGTSKFGEYQASYVNLEFGDNVSTNDRTAGRGATWIHISIVITANAISLYLDGQLISTSHSNKQMKSLISPSDFVIQAKQLPGATTEWSNNFGFRLDELYVFNRELGNSEIKRLAGVNW